MDLSQGSKWNKWDLHIHTPMSIIQEYGGDTNEVWDQFIDEYLAKLPKEIKVIAVTDYLFIDGYKYLLKNRDRFPNIELILPNIEFRLNTFSGTANHKKRHNFHVILSSEVETEDIESQLLNCLSNGYLITDNSKWQKTPTSKSLIELGERIKKEAPSKNSIHDRTDLKVGFENITYKLEDILENLDKDCFKGKFITCVGYSEWDQSPFCQYRWDTFLK